MKKSYLALLSAFLVVALLCSCNKSEDAAPRDVLPSTGEETYKVTFKGNWTKENHGAIPSNGHFTTLVGLTHSKDTSLFNSGEKATKGLEDVAEMGQVANIQCEIRKSYVDKEKGTLLTIQIPRGGTPTKEFTLRVNKKTSSLSLVSMIAPTADWFISFKGSFLNDDGTWKDNFTIDAIAYDAGTEDGEKFSLQNDATDPQENISRLNITEPLKINNGVLTPWFARLELVREKK